MDYGGDWIRMDSNFDNLPNAVSTMFKVSLTEGWLDLLIHGMNYPVFKGPDQMLVKNIGSSKYFGAFYFSLFIVGGCFFMLNLFDGVVIDNY